jgi:L-asparaginase
MQAFDAATGSRRRKLVVLGTGGTIAGLAAGADERSGYVAAQVGVGGLVAGLQVPCAFELLSEQVAQIDSKDMDGGVWATLAARCAHWLAQPDVQGVVVTHGTDTLEESAYFLQTVLAPRKPLVLTCAMRPADAAMPDGPQNLRDALVVAATPSVLGVVVVCAGVVHGAADVRKVHSYRLDAFGSGDAGPLAYVEAGVLRQVRNWPPASLELDVADLLPASTQDWPRVEIVVSHAGASGATVDALVRDGARGLVVAATGNGTVHHDLQQALRRAQAQGVRVLRASRCELGRVMGGEAGDFADAASLSPVKARIRLQLELLAQ